MVMALSATLTGVYTTDVNVNNVISQSIAGVNAPPAPVQAVANPTLNNPSVSAPAVSTTGSAIPGVRQHSHSLGAVQQIRCLNAVMRPTLCGRP